MTALRGQASGTPGAEPLLQLCRHAVQVVDTALCKQLLVPGRKLQQLLQQLLVPLQ